MNKTKSSVILGALLIIVVASIYFTLNDKNTDLESRAARQAVVNFLEGVKNQNVDQILDNVINTTISDQERLANFYTKDIAYNKLTNFKILKVNIIDTTHAEATVKVEVTTMGEVKHKFNLIKENGKWFVFIDEDNQYYID